LKSTNSLLLGQREDEKARVLKSSHQLLGAHPDENDEILQVSCNGDNLAASGWI
jgi:hypothetical protein